MTERLHFHFSLSRTGEGNGNPLQCSCLENPGDGAAWWAAVYGVAQSWTRLQWLSSSSSYVPRRPFCNRSQWVFLPFPLCLKWVWRMMCVSGSVHGWTQGGLRTLQSAAVLGQWFSPEFPIKALGKWKNSQFPGCTPKIQISRSGAQALHSLSFPGNRTVQPKVENTVLDPTHVTYKLRQDRLACLTHIKMSSRNHSSSFDLPYRHPAQKWSAAS